MKHKLIEALTQKRRKKIVSTKGINKEELCRNR